MLRVLPLLVCYALASMSALAASDETLTRVAERRIFFGHQSVGGNILDGISAASRGKLTINESRAADAFAKPGIVHTFVGENEAPLSKVADFEKAMEASGGKAEVAFFKFCYVDFNATTDVDALLSEYVAAHARLKAKYPSTTFVHVTVPLTLVQTGAKAFLKRLTGGAPWGERENAVRHRYNELLRSKFKGEPLFDLAAVEATKSDGTTQSYEFVGKPVPALVPAYSDDGGHLNATGQKHVAEALLSFLAKLP